MSSRELYIEYRPTSFKAVKGQPEVVKVLQNFVTKQRVPHAILFSGPSGCGKTTLARILRHKLACGDHDFFEVNAAEKRGIDFIRELQRVSRLRPVDGKCKVWIIDECHNLTKEAQHAFLKLLEDAPRS